MFKIICYFLYMEVFGTNIKQKTSKKIIAVIFVTIIQMEIKTQKTREWKSNIDNHNKTSKHIMATNGNKNKQKTSNNFECENCNKIYQTSSGLWKHTKKNVGTK